jgi:type IV fimbrial biogenesis protein FimT
MVRRPARGFTLPELLIVFTVLAVLMAAGLPSMAEFVRNQRVKTASFDLFSSLVFARSEAITRNAAVKVEPISGYWTNGWTVKDASGNLLRELSAVPNVSITLTAATTYIEFRGSGRLNTTTTPKFELAASGSTVQTRCIKIDLSGRPTTTTAACT